MTPAQRPVALPPETVEEQFRRLATVWADETGHLSSMAAASSHPAYQEIIHLGDAVVPFLLRDLEDHHNHWFVALRTITGANPIPAPTAGKIPEMAQAWLAWAKEQGYKW
jgi:hypothetical protein